MHNYTGGVEENQILPPKVHSQIPSLKFFPKVQVPSSEGYFTYGRQLQF